MKKYRNFILIALCLILTYSVNTISGDVLKSAANEPITTVTIGGFPIGLLLKPNGVIVVGASPVETELGSVTRVTSLKKGDIIENIDGVAVSSAEDIRTVLGNAQNMNVVLGVRRGASFLTVEMDLIKEDLSGENKLGLQIRESVAGVGTVTYVKSDGSFGCLGHPIILENESIAPCEKGYAYKCKILGYNKGMRGKAGELKGSFVGSTPCGTLYKNCKSGVYGKFNEVPVGRQVEVVPRKSVNIGKASILTSIDGNVEEYSIEIVKTMSQNTVSDKSMIIRITDKRLIAATGGIVQGMSGSPILQNGKLVGAVTYVFVSDPTKGYGIYADWMINN